MANNNLKEQRDGLIVNARRLILAGLILIQFVPLVVLGGVFYPFSSPKAFLFMAAAQFIFLVWSFLVMNRPEYRPVSTSVLFCFAGFMVALTLSTIFSAAPTVSFWSNFSRATGLVMHFHFFAFFLVLCSFFKTEKEWVMLISTAVGVAVLVSLWSLADNYNLLWLIRAYDAAGIVSEEVRLLSRGGSTMGNTSFMGSYLLINAFFALFLFFRSRRLARFAWAFTFTLIATGIMLNPGGRAMKGALLAGIILLALLYMAFVYKKRLVRIITSLLILITPAAVFTLSLLIFREGTIARSLILGVHGMPIRMVYWTTAWRGFLERPVLGWGLNNYEIALQRHRDPQMMLPEWHFSTERLHDLAHNVVFDHLVTAGAVGTLLYFAIIALALNALWQGCLKDNQVPFWTAATFTSLFAAHFIQNLTVFDTVTSYIFFYMALAYCVFTVTAKHQSRTVADSYRYYRTGYFTLPLIFLLISCLVLLHSHTVYRPFLAGRVVRLAFEDPTGQSIAEVDRRAAALTPMGRQEISTRCGFVTVALLKNTFEEQEESKAVAVVEGPAFSGCLRSIKARQAELYLADLEYHLIAAQQSIIESPLNYKLYYHLGWLNMTYSKKLGQAVSGKEDATKKAYQAAADAEDAYRQAIALGPNNMEAYWALAASLFRQAEISGEPEKYIEVLNLSEKAVTIEPRLIKSHEIGLLAAQLLEDVQLLKEKYAEAIAIDPVWHNELSHYIHPFGIGY
jgi:O-antigen ligase